MASREVKMLRNAKVSEKGEVMKKGREIVFDLPP
jgi:hypothetical protein